MFRLGLGLGLVVRYPDAVTLVKQQHQMIKAMKG